MVTFDLDAALTAIWRLEDLLGLLPVEMTKLAEVTPRERRRLAEALSLPDDDVTALLDGAAAADLAAADPLILESPWATSQRSGADALPQLRATPASQEWLTLDLPARWGWLQPASSSPSGVAQPDAAAAEAALRAALPAPVDEVLLQGDLTGVVPGLPTGGLGALLASAAVIETRGVATTVRFTPASIGRALRNGYSAADLATELAAHSPTPLPQPLEYLINDTARRINDPNESPLESPPPRELRFGAQPQGLREAPGRSGRLCDGAQESRRLGVTDGSEAGAPTIAQRSSGVAERPRNEGRAAPNRTGAASPALPAPWQAALVEAMRDNADVVVVLGDQTSSRRLTPLRYAGGRLRALDPERQTELTIGLGAIANITREG
ncbi:MAG: helicase-associated domain-containing protein [Promicromonosporaceae bacterium]|nr:helicase-associated domain-containing protein [Promicromonosporaceae bacterium]